MYECPTCGGDTDSVTPDMVDAAMSARFSWEHVLSYHDLNEKYATSLGELVKVAEQRAPEYEDADQGWQNPVSVVLELLGRFYKKFGYADSYGEVKWEKGMSEVFGQTKSVTVFTAE